MEKLVRLKGPAAPLLRINIDTDTIAPGSRRATAGKPRRFSEKGTDLSKNLFAALRYDEQDNELPEFVLNQPRYREARFLLAGANFGCGSSRESACWMLRDFGIRCVIAPSFGEIFHGNCFKNGMLPLTFDWNTVQRLAQDAVRDDLELDVAAGTLTTVSGTIRFTLPEFRRLALLNGLEEIEVTLTRKSEIDEFQKRDRIERPWVYLR